MEIVHLKVLKGPNYWSISRRKLIEMTLDLKQYENLPTNLLIDFPEHLQTLLPSLSNHHCSEGVVGGFFMRLKDGTWLGHVVEHVALELQFLAGMPCGFGRTRSTHTPGIYKVVFAYEVESAGIAAAKMAVDLVLTLARDKPYHNVQNDIKELKALHNRDRLGLSTEAILKEAGIRNIPYKQITDDYSIVMLGYGAYQKMLWTTVTDQTNIIGSDIATDKVLTKKLLAEEFIPVPYGSTLHTLEELDIALQELTFPLVIKPFDANHGRGITTNIRSKEQAINAFHLAKKISSKLVLEEFITGFDYRLLVINYKLIAAAKRTPALIIGDGQSTIQHLIDVINSSPNRGREHDNILTSIKIDDCTCAILKDNHLHVDSVLEKGRMIHLKNSANLSAGGTAMDVTDLVHPDNIFLSERIARIMGLDICGIDLIAEDIAKPLTKDNGAVIEVNAGPGLRMHLFPSEGKPRNVAKPVIDMLFPTGNKGRIPIIAVTGTNGKTTVVRLIAHIARKAGYHVGFTTTEGIQIDQQEIAQGDCSGPHSAERILRDPLVNFAVFECARGGILRAGLGFDYCSTSIVTNVSEDHLGIDDIQDINDLAKVKSVVAQSTESDGYAILNADDDLVYAMKEVVSSKIALFSLDRNNVRIRQHCENGGLAAYIDNDYLTIEKDRRAHRVCHFYDLTLSFNGKAECMLKNTLPALLAAIAHDFSIDDIIHGLQSFIPLEHLPGRMNIFKFQNFSLMVDYAHNEGAFIELKKYIDSTKQCKKICVIAATGDRREQDIQKVGVYMAQMFDEIIIRHDKDCRGKSPETLTELMMQGIRSVNSNTNVKVISDEFKAVQYAMNHAENGSFIFYFPDDVLKAVSYIKDALNNEIKTKAVEMVE